MLIERWMPYIPIYPNVQVPKTEDSYKRVVEPATRSEVSLFLEEEWPERVEALREEHISTAAFIYGPAGKEKPSVPPGQVLDLNL